MVEEPNVPVNHYLARLEQIKLNGHGICGVDEVSQCVDNQQCKGMGLHGNSLYILYERGFVEIDDEEGIVWPMYYAYDQQQP